MPHIWHRKITIMVLPNSFKMSFRRFYTHHQSNKCTDKQKEKAYARAELE